MNVNQDDLTAENLKKVKPDKTQLYRKYCIITVGQHQVLVSPNDLNTLHCALKKRRTNIVLNQITAIVVREWIIQDFEDTYPSATLCFVQNRNIEKAFETLLIPHEDTSFRMIRCDHTLLEGFTQYRGVWGYAGRREDWDMTIRAVLYILHKN